MKIEAVILDMDGLILDTEPLYKAAWQRAAADLGYELDDSFYLTLVGRPTQDCEEALLRRCGPAFPLENFRSRWPELWRLEVTQAGISTKPGLLEFLSFIDDHGLPVAVATSSDADYATFSLQQAGLDGRFGIIVTGDQVARGKPAPDIYVEAARRLEIDPAHCVALEDSEAGVISAAGAGMFALLIPDWTTPSDAAVQAAFRVLASLHEARQVVAALVANADPAAKR